MAVMNPQNGHERGTRTQSMRWIIDARWYYATLAFILGLIAREDGSSGQVALLALSVAYGIVLSANIGLLIFIKKTGEAVLEGGREHLVNSSQIALDLVFFFMVVLFTGGGVDSVGQSFFFVPIIVSIILFGFRGAIAVAVFSGFLVFLSVVVHSGLIQFVFNPGPAPILDDNVSLSFAKAGIIFMIYLLAGFFGGYISRMLRARDVLLREQVGKSEVQVARLHELSAEFDKSAKLLVRRDLELTNANDKLTQLDKMKSEIISVVAHQLRTPLSAIKWTLKILLDEDPGPITAMQRELIAKGFESNQHMITLVNDMLAVDRLESGKIKYLFVPVQFEDMLQDMIRTLLPIATQKNVRIEFSSPSTLMSKIKVDPDKMRDVVQNLIENAIKYTKPATTVSVGVAQEGNNMHFWVKDQGIGIPEAEKSKIFSRFFRAANAVRMQTEGSGLGLFIASSVVRRHGGEIWFDSVEEAGTTFHVTLPFST
jgi:signal transduction histidine kinase